MRINAIDQSFAMTFLSDVLQIESTPTEVRRRPAAICSSYRKEVKGLLAEKFNQALQIAAFDASHQSLNRFNVVEADAPDMSDGRLDEPVPGAFSAFLTAETLAIGFMTVLDALPDCLRKMSVL